MNFDVLNVETEIKGRKVLEASAGTGKTFAIEHIYLRLLIEDEPLTVPEILVVTFTKAAARELKARIRTNIENAFSFPYVNKLGSPEKIAKSLKEAHFFFDESQIFTIHGFCKRSLEEFAFESQGVVEDQKEMVSLMPYIRRFLRHLTEEMIPTRLIPVLFKNERELENLYTYLQEHVGKLLDVPPSWCEVFEKIKTNLKGFSVRNELFWEDFEKLFPMYKIQKLNEKNIRKEASLLLDLLENPDFSTCCSLSEKLQLTKFFAEKNKKKNFKDQKLNYPEFYAWIGEKLEEFFFFLRKDELKKRVAFFLQKSLEGEDFLFSYDEILLKMHQAIEKKSFREKLKDKYKAVIIDEFQDTDPLQWEIFHTLFIKESPVPIFYIVGDPKQSIYGFRKGDVYTYIEAVESLGSQNLFHLDTNYRSIPSLIEALNTFFQKKDFLLLPKKNCAIPYLPVKAGVTKDHDFNDGKNALHFFLTDSKADAESILFPFIAHEIRNLQEKGLGIESFAVLVKDRYQAKRLEDFFLKLSIPSKKSKQNTLKDSIALSFLKEILKAVSTPMDESRVKIALAGPFIGYSLKEIQEMEDQLPKEPFFKLQKIFMKEGIALFFAAFLEMSWKDKVLSKIKRDPLFFHEVFDSISHILEVNENLSLEEWISLLEEWEKKDIEMKSSPSEEKGVSILTMHKSKGLEFEVVFALGLISQTEIKGAEEEAEKLRLLYVAMTRAKKRLYVPFLYDDEKEMGKESSPLELFFSSKMSLQEAEDFFSAEKSWSYSLEFFQEVKALKNEEIIDNSTPPFIPIPKEEKSRIYSFSSLRKEDVERGNEKSTSLLPKGAEFGTFVHSILEKILLLLEITPLKVEEIIKKELAASFFKGFQEEILTLIQRALFTPLTENPNFYLANIPFEKRLVEVEFFSPYQKHYLKGYIDLVFSFEGKYYLLDWKTNDLGDYQEENLKKVVIRENYHLQAAIYTDAFQKVIKLLDPDPNFGGMFFIFLRGLEMKKGIFHLYPDLSLIPQISKLI